MYILHLTDLHLTNGAPQMGVTLRGLWHDVAPRLVRQTFDFVAITGDLVQSAKQDEYDGVAALLDDLVRTHVRDQDPRRVVMVPGNHDVDWEASCGTRIDPERLVGDDPDAKQLRTEFEHYLKNPESSDLRAMFNAEGKLETLLRTGRDEYPRRFAPCQKFLSGFYGPNTPAHDHRFMLTHADPARHWSAHVFEAEKIAFYGFSSCDNSDRYSYRARIHRAAIEAAYAHAGAHAPLAEGFTRVALWHHGIHSDRGMADHLSIDELEKLSSLGLALGMHGHTHQGAASGLRESLTYPFPVVATGSFAADPAQRQNALKQLSVIELTRPRIRVERYECSANGAWIARPADDQIFHRRSAPRPRRSQHGRSRVGEHHRRVTIDEDGIATVEIVLKEVLLDGELSLAHLRPTFSNMDFDQKVNSSTDPIDVVRSEFQDGSMLFSISSTAPTHHDELVWSYRVANAFALTRADLTARDPSWGLRLSPDCDAYAHIVKFPCSKLVLEVRLPRATIDRADVRAERRVGAKGSAWQFDREESDQIARVGVSAPVSAVRMSVDEPIPDHRYVLQYRVVEVGDVLPADALLVLAGTLNECRMRTEARQSNLPRALRDAVWKTVVASLAVGDSGSTPWVAYLWDSASRRLLPAFGNFPPHEWSVRFAHGEGIVGHAMRRRGPAVFVKGSTTSAGLDRLLVRRAEDARRVGVWLDDHDWIVAVPLLSGDAPIGVVAFADFNGQASSKVATRLREYAGKAVTIGRAAVGDQLDKLAIDVSKAFWDVLTQPDDKRASQRSEQGCDAMDVVVSCDHVKEARVKVRNHSVGGLGVVMDPSCDCLRLGSMLTIRVNGASGRAQVRYREKLQLGLALSLHEQTAVR